MSAPSSAARILGATCAPERAIAKPDAPGPRLDSVLMAVAERSGRATRLSPMKTSNARVLNRASYVLLRSNQAGCSSNRLISRIASAQCSCITAPSCWSPFAYRSRTTPAARSAPPRSLDSFSTIRRRRPRMVLAVAQQIAPSSIRIIPRGALVSPNTSAPALVRGHASMRSRSVSSRGSANASRSPRESAGRTDDDRPEEPDVSRASRADAKEMTGATSDIDLDLIFRDKKHATADILGVARYRRWPRESLETVERSQTGWVALTPEDLRGRRRGEEHAPSMKRDLVPKDDADLFECHRRHHASRHSQQIEERSK